jgi:dephospho-CoA kinase
MKPLVIGFAGRIGSGKSTISSCLAAALNWPRASFGEYVRTVARQRGLDESRETLQKLGESLINENAEKFCKSFLAQAKWKEGCPLIIEGIRHLEIVELLRKIMLPTEFKLIYITLDEQLRELRLHRRDAADFSHIQQIENHSTERDSKEALASIADLIVDGSKAHEDLSTEIITGLRLSNNNPCTQFNAPC